MRTLFFLLAVFYSSFVMSQTVQQLSFDQLQKKLSETKDEVVVLNFWATWCKPCVEELPFFEQLNEKYANQKVKVILVNLDFNSKIKSSVEPFVKNKKLKSEIWHITDTDPNTWIDQIDSTWSGAIPATVIYNSSHQKIKFNEGEMTYDELEEIVKSSLKEVNK
jgi:thiol-disulfide isomerase/thioredoxin